MINELIAIENKTDLIEGQNFFFARYGNKITFTTPISEQFTHVGVVDGVFSCFNSLKLMTIPKVFDKIIKVGDYVEIINDGGNNTKHPWFNTANGGVNPGQKYFVEDVDYQNDDFGSYTIKINNSPYRAIDVKIIFSVKNKKLTPLDAQEIIDIACPEWKTDLFSQWGESIVFKKDIVITENTYKAMRNACTPAQNIVFNRIFGIDEKLKFEVNNWLLHPYLGIINITNFDGKVYTFIGGKANSSSRFNLYSTFYENCRFATHEEILTKIKNIYPIGTYVYFLEDTAKKLNYNTNFWSGIKILKVEGHYCDSEKNSNNHCGLNFLTEDKQENCSNAFSCFRLATHEEIKSVLPIPKGTPCLVRDNEEISWRLSYATGEGKFFSMGRRDNILVDEWKYVIRIDLIKQLNIPE